MLNLPANLPEHVAIIMDGNARYAKRQQIAVTKGYEAGLQTAETIINAALETGIQHLTLFAFSTENWQRPPGEVNFIFRLAEKYIWQKLGQLSQKGIKLHAIGRIKQLPDYLQRAIEQATSIQVKEVKLNLYIAINYGGQAEITDACRKIAIKVAAQELSPADINEELFAANLYSEMPPVDLFIRTSNESRISNYLLWQLSYAEIFILPQLWPEFTPSDFLSVLEQYATRNRRFGKSSQAGG